ncbi:uncharacterized protein LOC114276534 isoform X2 [Camellia sinensis]|uniref:uncharacterized protein LOC114276534 isoform X2 n=2 Tax=Camellia sinensis TaxID=4442 RepID=UPI001036C435|nr:uncharacterized protein LOC114276534 isoform X2 [Camellia sinensis]
MNLIEVYFQIATAFAEGIFRTSMASNDVRMKNASGKAPDVGAIFMSNRTTIEECFKRKLFGLPHSFVDFVKEVKAGMVLFLFEFEQRKLYGVFQAVTDGSMNIVPNAYRSTGKSFPAQIRFSVIWNCRPLYEHDFCDAIQDNYYAATKFNFGLSKDQVQRLLYLFDSRKVRVQRSLKKKKVKSLDIVNPLADSGKLELKRDDSMAESQARNSVDVPQSLNAGISFFQAPFVSGTSNEFTSFHEYATHSTGISVSSSFSLSQSVPLQKESEHIDTSSYNASLGLGDYIPLSFPEHLDATENENAFSEAGVLKDNQIESASCDDYIDLSSSEACIFPMPFGLMDSNQPSSVFSPERDQCDEKYPRVKGLYSDTQDKRTSVFSRLNLVSKAAVEDDEDDSQVTESVHEIMEKLQWSHENWKRTTRKTKSISREKGDSHLKKRASVFSRLNFASDNAVEEKKFDIQVDNLVGRNAEIFLGNKRETRKAAIRNHDSENLQMTIQVQMNEDTSQVEEDLVDKWTGKQIGECIPLLNVNDEGKMVKIECETKGRDHVDGEEQQKRRLVRPMLTNKSDAKTEDNQTRLSQNDIKPALIYPTISDGNSEEQLKGSTKMDSMLIKQDGPGKNCFGEVGTKPLNVCQLGCLSASAAIKDVDKEVLIVDEGQAECTKTFFGTGREECGEQDAGLICETGGVRYL